MDPTTAPPRPDLTFLRRRSRPKPATPDPGLADFIAGHATHTGAGPRAESPTTPAARPATPAPQPVTPAAQQAGDLLDLTPQPPAATSQPARRARAAVHRDARVRAGEQHLLTNVAPTVTLTRVQSGIGQLQIEAVCSRAVGDLRLGAAYQLASGPTSTVQFANRFAPSSRRPVIVAGRDEFEHLRVDLRQARDLERLMVYAFSESRADLTWGGTLIVTTFGAARIELPLESLHPGRVAVLASIYNLDGEFVVRAEMETVQGDVRKAARAYGFDRITWRDDRDPAD